MNKYHPKSSFNVTEKYQNPKVSKITILPNNQQLYSKKMGDKSKLKMTHQEYGMHWMPNRTQPPPKRARDRHPRHRRMDRQSLSYAKKQSRSVDVNPKSKPVAEPQLNSGIFTSEYKKQLSKMNEESKNLNQIIKRLKQGFIEQSTRRLKELKSAAGWCNRDLFHVRKKIPTPCTDYYMEIREENLQSKGLKSAFDDLDDKHLLAKYTPVSIPVEEAPAEMAKSSFHDQHFIRTEASSRNQARTLRSLSAATGQAEKPLMQESFSFSRNLVGLSRKKHAPISSTNESLMSVKTSKKPFYKVPDYFNRSLTRELSESSRRHSPFYTMRPTDPMSIKNTLFRTLLYSEKDPHSTYFGDTSIKSNAPRRD